MAGGVCLCHSAFAYFHWQPGVRVLSLRFTRFASSSAQNEIQYFQIAFSVFHDDFSLNWCPLELTYLCVALNGFFALSLI